MARITVLDRRGYYDPRNAILWALGRVLVGGPAEPRLWNPPDGKSILRLPLSIFETEGNLTATAKEISPDDATAFRYLIHLPDQTNLSYYYYRNPTTERNRINRRIPRQFWHGRGGRLLCPRPLAQNMAAKDRRNRTHLYHLPGTAISAGFRGGGWVWMAR